MEKKIKLYTIPNAITLLNLACGCAAAVATLCFGDVVTAFYLIVLAAVFDFLDGFAARLLKSYSETGKQLDSLADMVSFGFVPGAIMYTMYAQSSDQYLGYGVFLVTLFSALRLAKFNVDESQSDSFVGLPTPACAIFVGSVAYILAMREFVLDSRYLLVAAVVLSFLLVSPIRMFALKFKNFSLRDNKLRYGFIAAAITAFAIWQIVAVPFVIMGYVVVSVAQNLLCRAKRA